VTIKQNASPVRHDAAETAAAESGEAQGGQISAAAMEGDRLKIAFVVDRFGARFGGAEAYGVALMRELASSHDITVFAREYDTACGLALPYVPLRSWRGWPSWVRVLLFAIRARRATRQGFDIVHSHMNGWSGDVEVVHVTPVRYNWRVRKLPLLKRLLSYASPRVQTYLGLEQKRVRPRPGHRTVAVSGLIADQLAQAYGGELPVPVIPPGVTSPTDIDPATRARLREAQGWLDTDQVCLLVARNPLRKGLPTVLQALAMLPDNVKLLVVGGNAGTREFVVKFRQGELFDRVRVIDATSEIGQYYQAADVYVHPTLNDSFGMAPLEAMSYGLPVVLSPQPWCGFAQYVCHGTEALVLADPENADQLAQYLRRLAQEPDLRGQLVAGGAQVVRRHSWAEAALRYLALYREVRAERAG
jgi:UDP-glucose:(heptosyl)LPS alpha-1,3-glucosyltransferase